MEFNHNLLQLGREADGGVAALPLHSHLQLRINRSSSHPLLEHCAIALDTQLQQQLQANPKAVFQMKYSESENSLVLSFYLKEDTKTYPNVDFFIYNCLNSCTFSLCNSISSSRAFKC